MLVGVRPAKELLSPEACVIDTPALQIVRDITPTILGRTAKLCNFLDYQDYKVRSPWPGRSGRSARVADL